jgi:asparagine synthase (glutamine-hydrolysing)
MFAFALWDAARGVLFWPATAWRKPLYYTFHSVGCSRFRAEITAVVPQVGRQLDPQAIEDFFAFGA